MFLMSGSWRLKYVERERGGLWVPASLCRMEFDHHSVNLPFLVMVCLV